jgi:hypothetical protein
MSLTALPYDILFNVVRLLDVEEQVNLGKTSPVFRYICGEESLCRISAEVRHSICPLASFLGWALTCGRETCGMPWKPV